MLWSDVGSPGPGDANKNNYNFCNHHLQWYDAHRIPIRVR